MWENASDITGVQWPCVRSLVTRFDNVFIILIWGESHLLTGFRRKHRFVPLCSWELESQTQHGAQY